MPKVFEKLLRAGEGRVLKRLEGIAAQVNALEDDFEKLTDEELRNETDVFKQRLADGESLDDILPEAFAAVREASKRTIGKRHFDVQIMGGAALHQGNVAEMKTGEGKTLVATLPSYLNALAGKGVHVITVNDYLAEYQSELMGRIHRALGLETGVILALDDARRSVAWSTPRTSPTAPTTSSGSTTCATTWPGAIDELVQRGHNFAIVDEVDSILIDEARTPLIISGPADQATKWYVEFAKIVQRLRARRAGVRRGRLRGRREEAHRRRARGRHREGRGPARHRQPLRVGQHPAHRLPQQRAQGQGAVQARQGLRRHQRRDPHRRRAHRTDAPRPPLQRGHAPGDRGQRGRRDPEREPDPRDDHAAELLPHVRHACRA